MSGRGEVRHEIKEKRYLLGETCKAMFVAWECTLHVHQVLLGAAVRVSATVIWMGPSIFQDGGRWEEMWMIYRSSAAPRLKQYPQPNLPPHFALSLPLLFFLFLLASSAAVPSLRYVPAVISLSLDAFRAIFSSFSTTLIYLSLSVSCSSHYTMMLTYSAYWCLSSFIYNTYTQLKCVKC